MSKASAAKGSRSRYARKGVLIEEGRTWLADGKEVRRYTCGWRRLVVSVIGRRVAIARECGVVCSGITLSFVEVERVAAFLAWWHGHRVTWAAFYWSGAGHPAGFGSATAWYQASGGQKAVRVASMTMKKLSAGKDFVGHDVTVVVDPPVRVPGRAKLVARVVRRGERFGDPAGEEVGGHFRMGTLELDADRNDVRVTRGEHEIVFEPEEHLVLERLLVVERTR